MEKIKPLLPTLKEKKRYVVFEIISKKSIEMNKIYEMIENSYRRLFGEFGLAKAGLIFLKNKSLDQKGIVRVNRKCVDKLKTAFTFINSGIIVNCIGVSGILKKAYYKYVKTG